MSAQRILDREVELRVTIREPTTVSADDFTLALDAV
jgi:hypothetical protein